MIEHTPSSTALGASTESGSAVDRASWDNLRLFLAVAEAGSFRSAAVRAAVSINTIRSKVDRLERRIGTPLLKRSVEGVALTQDGREMLQIARDLRALGQTTGRVTQTANSAATVRVAASEGVGTTWLAAQLAAHQSQNPGFGLSLDCGSRASDVLFRDIDLSVQIETPRV